MSYATSRNVAILFGVTFVVVGILGFIPNPLVSSTGLFEVNGLHNLVHVLTGVVFIVGALPSERAARLTLQSVGIAYIGVTILGFLTEGHLLLGLVHINDADRWLHAGLALVIVGAGFGLPKPKPVEATNTV